MAILVARTRPRVTFIRTRWFKYDRSYLCVSKSQFVPVTRRVSVVECLPLRHAWWWCTGRVIHASQYPYLAVLRVMTLDFPQ
jgi:hypothetical protein